MKVLDDLTDEGYTNLNNTMEADFSCLTRLRAVLYRYGEVSFPINHERLSGTVYKGTEFELEEVLGKLMNEAAAHSDVSTNLFKSMITLNTTGQCLIRTRRRCITKKPLRII